MIHQSHGICVTYPGTFNSVTDKASALFLVPFNLYEHVLCVCRPV